MSAKLLYNLSDENPNLHKQIGCMNGIFQVFYRQHYPARRVVGHGHKTPLSGETSNEVNETNLSIDKETTTEKTKRKASKEKQRISSESSSRPSFSSSPRSSSFSSADVSTASQFEPPASIQTNSVESCSREPPNRSPRWGSLTQCDLRELVKGSIHRDGTSNDITAGGSSESLLKESLRSHSQRSCEGKRVSHLKDSPRLSYDERELRNNSYKTGAKSKEPPRLSLDSRSNSFTSSRTEDHLCHRRTTSSVVAKLMGLEILADATAEDHHDSNNRQNPFCDSPRPSYAKAAAPQRSRSVDSIKKQTSVSKIRMEPAPWKQTDGARARNPSPKPQAKAADSALTVYGEIQKRLTQLEFKKSGKDLRALKQILEAMEKTQNLMEGKKDEKSDGSSLVKAETNQTANLRSSIVVMKPAQDSKESDHPASPVSRNAAGLSNLRAGNSRQIRKGLQDKPTAMDLTPRPGLYKNRLDSTAKNSSGRPRQTLVESCSPKNDSAKSSRSQQRVISPRMQQKKLRNERHSRPTTPTSESAKIPKQQTDLTSPRRKKGTKSRNLQQSDDRLSDASAKSLRSDSNISSVANADIEVTSRYRFEKSCQNSEQHTPKQRSPDRPMLKPVKLTLEQPSPVSVLDAAAFYEDESPSPVRKISTVFTEDDSVSVEEAEWMKDDSSQMPTSFRRSIVLSENHRRLTHTDSDLVDRFVDEVASTCDLKNSDHEYISEILSASGLLRDLEYCMISVQLHQSRHPINPSLFSVLEQNKTSDAILQYVNRGKGTSQINHTEKTERKLVFDTINEILARKFVEEGCTKPQVKSSPLMEKRSRGKYLLQSLCSEIDRLRANNSECDLGDDEDIIWEDLENQGTSWRDFEGETPAIVLDIERMIFRDLISEAVTSEVAAVRTRAGGQQPRQLFPC